MKWLQRLSIAGMLALTLLMALAAVGFAQEGSVLDSPPTDNSDPAAVVALPAQEGIASISAATAGPLRVSSANRRYFADATGRVVYLAGAHTWSNLQDTGAPPITFDYTAYLNFLTNRNLNFFRLWAWEQAMWGSWTPSNIEFTPLPYLRTGPGTAQDGKLKFDLNQFDEGYFTRLRQRVSEARDRGIYVSVMLFDGWSIEDKQSGGQNPWRGHPFNAANNINGINGDPNNNGQGSEVHTLSVSAVTALQQAYIRKVVDTVNDLDNVLYEISNESHSDSTAWQYAMINYLKGYEQTKAFQHPVGMTVQYPNGSNDVLMQSPADWVSPNDAWSHGSNPPDSAGAKVVVADTDHIWGIGGDVPWVWKSFTRGINTLFMDPYDCSPFWPPSGCTTTTWEALRLNLGYARSYADRLNLAAAVPRNDLCSTGFCLANPTAGSAEFLVYQPNSGAFTVNLSGLAGTFSVEWLNPDNGGKTTASAVAGGSSRSFTPPFSGDAVLFLKQTGSGTPTSVPTSPPTATAAATATPTAMPTATATKTATPAPTATVPTATPAATATAALSPTPNATPTATRIVTATPAATATPVATATATAQPSAPFPSSPLRDNFNRANGSMGTNWMYQPSSFGVNNRRLRMPATGFSAWRSATFSSNQEAYVRLNSVATTVREVGILLKGTFSNNTLVAGITVGYQRSTGRVQIGVVNAQGWQALSPTLPFTLAANDQLGARARSNGVIEVFRNGVLLGSANAGAALGAAGGRIGLYADYASSSGSTLLDDFGGGDVASITAAGYQLQVSTSVVGSGAVQVEPAGAIVCGQPVTIIAVPAAGWQFGGWTGDVVETQNPLAYDLTGSLTLFANFIPDGAERPYSVAVQSSGEGSVVVEPAGPYAAGQVVKLTAQANAGWIFTGWSNAQPEDNNPLALQVAGDVALTANFAPATNLYLPSVLQAADSGAAAPGATAAGCE